jgi:hypothetical protein
MAIYSLARRTTDGTAAAAAMEMRTASTDRPRLMEMGVFMAAATASQYGLGRPAAIGVTPTSPVTVLAEDPGDSTGTVTTALAWSTAPTVPANFFRRVYLPATLGAGIYWVFPRGLVVAVSSSIVLWNIGSNGVVDTHVVVDE